MFENLIDRLENSFKILKGEGKITEINVAETLKDIRKALLDADVSYKIAKKFCDDVKQIALGQDVLKSVRPSQMMVKIVHDELTKLMGSEAVDINIKGTPGIVLVAGLQGSGKTTFSGKLALNCKNKRGLKVLLVAGDVYRPAAIDQLKVLGEQIGVRVYSEEGSKDPVAIANNAGAFADGYDVQIAKLIAAEIGVELVIKAIEWDGLIPALEAGEIDMIIAGMSPTEERKLSIDFSNTYFDSNLVMVVRKDGNYTGATKISDFNGAKITGQLNTFHYTVIDQINGVNKQTALADFAALTQSLASGAIDGYVCEKPGAESAIASNDEFTYIEFAQGNGFTCDPAESSISVGLRKGSTLTDTVNAAIAKLSAEAKEAMMNDAIARQPAEN